MRPFFQLICVALIPIVAIALSGCNNRPSTEANHEQHEHDHGHEHAEGPHGGHLLELTGADEEYHAEWLHDDEHGIITVYLLQEDGQTPIDNPPAVVTIEVRSGNSPQTYELPATDSVDDLPTEAAYSITDPALVTALQIVVEGDEPLLHVAIGEKPVSAKFEKHEHDEHHHDH